MGFVPDNVRWGVLSRLLGPTRAARRLGATVGEGCRLLSFNVSSEPWLVRIGDRVTVTTGVHLVTHDGAGWLVRDERGRRFRYAGIEIGDDVFVGINAVLLPGVRIGSRVVVAAGSVVTRSVPDGVIVAGAPARVIDRFERFEERALAAWSTAGDQRGTRYRDRVDSVVEHGWRPELELPWDADVTPDGAAR